jgi:hypothetical protein
MQKLKTLQEFDAVKSSTKTIAVTQKARAHRRAKVAGWDAIRVALAAFWANDKTMLVGRWQALQDLVDLCNAYRGDKETSERSGNRAIFAEELGNQAFVRLWQEKAKAIKYGSIVNEPPSGVVVPGGRRSPGVAVGGQGKPSAETRFERALPDNSVYHGKQLADRAKGAGGIVMTGDDFTDAYALRAYVKKIEAANTEQRFRRDNKIPYFTDTERASHQLTIQTQHVLQQGRPLSTVGLRAPSPGVSDHQAMYAMGQDGRIYVRKNIDRFNHSCFTAGESVICAGMITAINGRLIHISNGSGHYCPGMNELLDALDVIAGSTYANYHDCYVLYQDFANLYGRGSKAYRIPWNAFRQASGMVANPQDFEADVPRGVYAYQYNNLTAASGRGASIDPRIAQ